MGISTRIDQGRELYRKLVNPRMGEAVAAMGFDRDFVRGQGAYLFDAAGARYLDFIAGYGACFVGRNHPAIARALHDAIESELPNLVQMDSCAVAGLLAHALLEVAPRSVEMAYFASSGAEAVETAIKFSRRHTGKRRIIYLDNAFHGMTCGALALNGTAEFRAGFGPLLPGTAAVPPNDIPSLAAELAAGDVAAVIVEPIQGQGVVALDPTYAAALQRLCKQHGALVIADEVMTGLGRTGRWFACEHLGLEPDLLLVSKTLSGGFVPVSAVLLRRAIYDSVYSSTDRAGIHFSTFSQNKLAMVAGLATLDVIRSEQLVERAARFGGLLAERLAPLREQHDALGPLRGKGLMLGVELRAPVTLLGRLDWIATHRANRSLFALKLSMDLLAEHRVLTLPSGRDTDVIGLLPPAVITDEDIDTFVTALDAVLARARKFPGVFLGAMTQFAQHAIETNFRNGRGDEP
jgi:acetylornithine/succinyldiaminopimelate/putrescine aminotransferase